MDKTNLILNSTIELVDVQEEGNGKGRPFVSRFIEPGIAHYKELGDILITKETLNKFINTMVGCPVIIEHEDVTDANADKLRVGVVSRVWFSEMDGYFYCEGILTDPEAIDLVKNQGYNVSCAYSFVSDNTKRTHNGKEIDMEFIDGEFLHLALVKDPRYEGANIVVNKNDDDLQWVTIKGNHVPIKKGQSKDEAVKEFLEGKKESSSKDYEVGDKITFDTNWRGVSEKIKEGTIIGKEKKLGTKDDPNPDYQYKVKTDDGKTILVEKEAVIPKDKSGDNWEGGNNLDDFKFESEDISKEQGNALYNYFTAENKNINDLLRGKSNEEFSESYKDRLDKNIKQIDSSLKPVPDNTKLQRVVKKDDIKKLLNVSDIDDSLIGKEFHQKGYTSTTDSSDSSIFKTYGSDSDYVTIELSTDNIKGISMVDALVPEDYDEDDYEYRDIAAEKEVLLQRDTTTTVTGITNKEGRLYITATISGESSKNVSNSIGDITMQVLNELKDFIKSVVSNEKEEEMKEVKNEDKRKLIDEVGGILKDKVDEELWRTVIGKLEKIAYEPSEDDKADNEKEAKNKCKNEEDEEPKEDVTKNEDKPEDDGEDEEEDKPEDKAENKKVKNSMRDMVMGGSSNIQEQKLYISRKERLEEGNKY